MSDWQDIPGYEGKYQVSNKGEIRNIQTGKPLKLSPDADGYLKVKLTKGSPALQYDFKVHRLVAQLFIEGDVTMKVDHINRIRSDNRVENLRWATDSLNSRNRIPKGKSKVIGVRFRKEKKNPWQAYGTLNGRFSSLGHFATFEEACAARQVFNRIFGFHDYS